MTRLPEQVLQYLEAIAAPFGGVTEVLSLLPDSEIEKLVTFPGKIFVVKPWAAAIDLREVGYTEGTPYSLLDNDLRLIKTDYSLDGYFGQKEEDLQILLRADHASFLYLLFSSQLVLLWVCNRLTKQQINFQISQWQKLADQIQQPISSHELFLYTKALLPTDRIQVIHVPTVWSQRFTIPELRAHPHRQISEHRGSDEVICLYLQNSGWYLFEVVRGAERLLLEIRELQGVGINKVRFTDAGTYFIALTGREQTTAAKPSILQLPSNVYGIQGVEPFIRLEGTLIFREPDRCVGFSLINAFAGVIHLMRPAISVGISQCIAALGESVDGIATGVALQGVKHPLALESEPLHLTGVASIGPADNVRYCSADAKIHGVAILTLSESSSGLELLTGVAEVIADIMIMRPFTTLFTPAYASDPFELLPLTFDLPATLEPLQRIWYTVEYKPYTYIAPNRITLQPIAVGIALASAEMT